METMIDSVIIVNARSCIIKKNSIEYEDLCFDYDANVEKNSIYWI